jgi:bacterioferritin-associated ferredoxin
MMQPARSIQGQVMYVCVCNAITDRQIREAVLDGASNLRQLRARLPLGRGCGRCVEAAQEIVAGQSAPQPVGHLAVRGSRRILACQDA